MKVQQSMTSLKRRGREKQANNIWCSSLLMGREEHHGYFISSNSRQVVVTTITHTVFSLWHGSQGRCNYPQASSTASSALLHKPNAVSWSQMATYCLCTALPRPKGHYLGHRETFGTQTHGQLSTPGRVEYVHV
jgi:hypothetical protein